MSTNTDRIEREIMIKAPRSKVWRALSNAEEFGRWFGVGLEGKNFEPGKSTRGQITIKGFEHVEFSVKVERVEPETLLSMRWHPYAIDPDIDYSKEQATLIVFQLAEVDGGTLLSVVESGFDSLPPERRAEAFRMNSGGWEAQLKNIARYAAAG